MSSPLLPARIPLLLNPAEKHFVLFVSVLGMTGGEAYRLAFSTTASNISATAMASKLLKEERIQNAIRILYRHYDYKGFGFNENVIKY